jgi:glycosyltransferase involved in cell wall biosynthesis
MLVVHIASTKGPGGVVTAVGALCKSLELVDANSSVHYFARSGHESISEYFAQLGIRTKVWNFRIGLIHAGIQILLATLQGKVVILHAHTGLPVITRALSGLLTIFGRFCPCVLSIHGPHNVLPQSANSSMWLFHASEIHRWDAVVLPSVAESSVHASVCGGNGRLYVAPHSVHMTAPVGAPSVNVANAEREDSEPIILFVGRFAREKNADLLLRMFPYLRHPGARLVLVGDGPEKQSLFELVENMNDDLRRRVIFAGHVTNPANYYLRADVFVSLSEFESFGLVAYEAALAGVPMLLSPIEPWLSSFQKQDGCVFSGSRDPRDIAAAIDSMLLNRNESLERAVRARNAATLATSPQSAADVMSAVYVAAMHARAMRQKRS